MNRRHTSRSVAVAIILVLGASVLTSCQERVDTYVALGDSYTSGPGITSEVPNQPGQAPGCDRSNRAYPALTFANLVADGLDVDRYWDLSCSGATTAHFANGQPTGNGTNLPQLYAVGSATRFVTIGIGGNDIGFVGIARGCVSLSDVSGTYCKQNYVHDGRDALRDRIDALAPRIAQLIEDVRQRGPNAQIYLVGYPTLLPASGWCADAPIRDADGAYLRGVREYLNQMLATQAQAHGAFFVDTATSSVGHDACAGAQAWVNGANGVPGDGVLAHPNAAGMAHTAQLVTAAIKANNP